MEAVVERDRGLCPWRTGPPLPFSTLGQRARRPRVTSRSVRHPPPLYSSGGHTHTSESKQKGVSRRAHGQPHLSFRICPAPVWQRGVRCTITSTFHQKVGLQRQRRPTSTLAAGPTLLFSSLPLLLLSSLTLHSSSSLLLHPDCSILPS